MPLIPISDLEDSRLNVYRDLPRSNLTPQSGRFIVEGKWLAERLAASQFAVESILVAQNQTDLLPEKLDPATPIYVLPQPQIEQVIGFHFHRGILACGRRNSLHLWEQAVPRQGPLLLVAVHDVHDPTNLGSILRNAAAFGVDGLLLNRRCADPFSRRVLRVSMGTAFKLQLFLTTNMESDLRRLRSDWNCELFATTLARDAECLEAVRTPLRSVLLIGNEGHGLPDELVAVCNRRVTLPMKLETDSLNAAAATAVFLYHFTRIGAAERPIPGASGD